MRTELALASCLSRISAAWLHGASVSAASMWTCASCLKQAAALSAAVPMGITPASAQSSRTMSIYTKKPPSNNSTPEAAGTSAAATSSTATTHSMTSWFKKLRTALLPVPAATPKPASQAHKPSASGVAGVPTAAASQPSQPSQQLVPLSATTQRLLQAKEAARAREQAGEVFIPLSSDAERFSGLLFKVSIAMITIPLAIWFVSTQLLVTLCIKGLRSPNPAVVKISLSRVQSYVFTEALARWFEKDDGVVLLVSMLGHQAVLGDPDVMLPCLATITHLMKFEETRTALLLGMVTERLKKALDQGLVAADAVEEGRRVYHSLEAMKQLHMEQMFGVAEGGSN